MVSKKDVMEKLKEVIDPEIGMNIVDMGLILDVKIEGKEALVKMTLTTPFCPLAGLIVEEVEKKIMELGLAPKVELIF